MNKANICGVFLCTDIIAMKKDMFNFIDILAYLYYNFYMSNVLERIKESEIKKMKILQKIKQIKMFNRYFKK